MGKFISKIKDILGNQKELLKKYCLTFIIIAITTLLMIILGFETKDYQRLYTILILTDVLVFMIETWTNIKWYRIPMYLGAAGVGTISMKVLFNSNRTDKQILFVFGIYFISAIISLYKIVKDSKLTLSEYVTKWFNNSVLWGVATIVIQLGVLFIVTIINSLLFNNSFYDVITKTEIFILGFVIIPGEILCMLNTKNEVIKPIRILLCFIVTPIVNIAEIVIYIYLFKILITREIPSNTIYPIIAGLFTFACPTWIMIDSFKDKYKYIKLNAKAIPYSFIALIALQIYSIGIRVAQVGLTPQRYLAIMLVLFEIITVILTIIKDRKYINNLFIITIGLATIMCIIPGINVIDASWKSQLKRLEMAYEGNKGNFEALSKENKLKAKGAYYYLKNDDEGKKHIPDYVVKKDIESVVYDAIAEEENYREDTYISYDIKDEKIDIDEYNRLSKIEIYSYENKKVKDIDIEEFEIYQDKNDKNQIVMDNIKKFLQETIEEKEVRNNLIKLDDNNSYLVESLELRYDETEEKIEYLRLSGALLEK